MSNYIANNQDGITLSSSSKNNKIDYNKIYNNTKWGIISYSRVNAANNWWGNVSGPYHHIKNPNGTGDNVSDYVDFEPWLIKPIGVKNKPPTIECNEYVTVIEDISKWMPINISDIDNLTSELTVTINSHRNNFAIFHHYGTKTQRISKKYYVLLNH